jgi:hypothetical protein
MGRLAAYRQRGARDIAMALAGTGANLGDKIANLIIAPNAPPAERQRITALWEDIGKVIVSHLISNIELEVARGIPVSTSGTETSQKGETTDKGTGVIK